MVKKSEEKVEKLNGVIKENNKEIKVLGYFFVKEDFSILEN
jgi:hypothetical protein